jgi:hypothetical protein
MERGRANLYTAGVAKEASMQKRIRAGRGARAAGQALLALAAAASPAALNAQSPMTDPEHVESASAPAARTAETSIDKWPEGSRDVARVMIEKYGEPDQFSDDALVWKDKGSWKRSVVYRTALPRLFGPRDKDYLEQSIRYRVPGEKLAELKRFDKRIRVDELTGEMSSRSESEPLNFLTLNLAEEIVSEKRSVEDAREVYRKVTEFYESGKSSPYLNGFVFSNDTDSLAAPGRFATHEDFFDPKPR